MDARGTLTVQRQIAVYTDDPDNELMQLSMRVAPMYTQKQSDICVYGWAESAQAARVKQIDQARRLLSDKTNVACGNQCRRQM